MLVFLVICAVFAAKVHSEEDLGVIELQAEVPRVLAVVPCKTTKFTVASLPMDINYVVFQAHSQRETLNISSTKEMIYGESKSGTSVGLVTLLSTTQTQASWFLTSTANKTITILVMAQAYNGYVPVVGGCNMEFSLPEDPNLHVTHLSVFHKLGFAWAATPFNRSQQPSNCEDLQKQKGLHYKLYVKYMTGGDLNQDHMFNELKKVLTVQGVHSNATQLRRYDSHEKGSASLASFPRRGAIYTVVVSYTHEVTRVVHSATYTPYVTYSCSFDEDASNNCMHDTEVSQLVLVLIMTVFGFFICFFGHRYFKSAVFYFGFMAFGIISYIILARFTTLPHDGLIWLGAMLGVVGGCLWLLFWLLAGIPVLIVLLASLVHGYLLASLIFTYTPLDTLQIMETPVNYGMSFASCVLIIPVIFLAASHKLHIVSCAVVGAFWLTMGVCIFLDATLVYAFLHTLHKAVLPEFISVSVLMPLEMQDLFLVVLWVIVAGMGIAFQIFRERGHPQFPPCPYDLYRRRHELQVPINHGNTDHSGYESFSERSPLLSPRPPQQQQPLVDPI